MKKRIKLRKKSGKFKRIKKNITKKKNLSKLSNKSIFNIDQIATPYNSNEYLINYNSSSFFPIDEDEESMFQKENEKHHSINIDLDIPTLNVSQSTNAEDIDYIEKTKNIKDFPEMFQNEGKK